jgi:hypothetical protein
MFGPGALFRLFYLAIFVNLAPLRLGVCCVQSEGRMASGHFVIASTALAFILGGVAESVASTVIPLEVSVNGSQTSFYTADLHFNLPAGFTNASISISEYFADDRSVMQLNGVDVASFGIFGPGTGSMLFGPSGPYSPSYIFQYGSPHSPPFDPPPPGYYADITSPFVVGDNLIRFFVNDTSTGINSVFGEYGLTNGPLGTPGPTFLSFKGSLTYDVAQTPLPAALPLFASGLGLVGLALYRRRRKQAATPA